MGLTSTEGESWEKGLLKKLIRSVVLFLLGWSRFVSNQINLCVFLLKVATHHLKLQLICEHYIFLRILKVYKNDTRHL